MHPHTCYFPPNAKMLRTLLLVTAFLHWSEFTAKNIKFMAAVVSSIPEPFVLFTKHQCRNSPLSTRQGTRKAKKMLKLTIQGIAEAVLDIENLNVLTWYSTFLWLALQLSSCQRSLATGSELRVLRRRMSQATTVVSLSIQISSK